MSEVIFTTVHGSRLYGFAHDGSDFDTFTVTTSTRSRAHQTLDDAGNDRVVIGFDAFLALARSGSHQSVEALFSPVKQWGDSRRVPYVRPMLERTRIAGGDVFQKYERTIRKFCYGDLKRRRHAVRLRMNLVDLRAYGRFNPTLNRAQIAKANSYAGRFEGDALADILHVRTT